MLLEREHLQHFSVDWHLGFIIINTENDICINMYNKMVEVYLGNSFS